LTIATVRTSNPTKSNQIRIATQEEKHSNIDKGEKDEEKRDDDDDDDDVVVVVVVVLVDPDCIQNGSCSRSGNEQTSRSMATEI
jgi:hypothetical protein